MQLLNNEKETDWKSRRRTEETSPEISTLPPRSTNRIQLSPGAGAWFIYNDFVSLFVLQIRCNLREAKRKQTQQ